MKTIDLNFELKDLNGNPLSGESNAGKFVASMLMIENSTDSIKFYDWAMTLHNKKPISIDDADFIMLKELVKNHKQITVLAKAPIEKYFATIK